MFNGKYPPFTLDSNGALLVTTIGTGTAFKGKCPPFTLDSNGAILLTTVLT